MQTSTLPDLIKREGIPLEHPIFRFRRTERKGIIEFALPVVEEAKPATRPAEILKRLQALQIKLGRQTNGVKVIRALRNERVRPSKTRSTKRK